MGTRARIAAMGSSGTYGIRVDRSSTWPARLEERLRRDGIDAEVRNFATPGLPLEAYAERVLLLEREWSPHLYVLQLPPPGRAYFGVNGGGRSPERHHPLPAVLGWRGLLDATAVPSPTRIALTRLLAREGSPFYRSLRQWLYPIVRQNDPDVTFEQFSAFAAFWDLHAADSDLQRVMHGKEIVALQLLLDRLHKPYIMFDWHLYNGTRDKRLSVFADYVAWNRFIASGKYSAFEFLGAVRPGRLDDLTVDPHGHLNAEGHRLVAEEFVLPAVLGTFDANLLGEDAP